MAAYTSFLLVAALCLGTAYSLRCYTCTAASSNANCMTATNCTSGLNYCQTSVGSASAFGVSVASITKICTASCTPSSTSLVVGSASISCCQTDLCNTSGAISVQSSYAAIFVVLGTAMTLLSSSFL